MSNSNIQNINNLKKNNIILILFHATWCGHCLNFRSVWEQLKQNHPKGLKLGEIEDNEMNQYTYSKNEKPIEGYPTLRLYHKDKLLKEYDGERKFEDIYDYLKNFLKKNKNLSQNNMVIMSSKKGNKINKKLVKKIISNKKNKNKLKKKRNSKNNLVYNQLLNNNENSNRNNINIEELNLEEIYNQKSKKSKNRVKNKKVTQGKKNNKKSKKKVKKSTKSKGRK